MWIYIISDVFGAKRAVLQGAVTGKALLSCYVKRTVSGKVRH
jgi:hypothetical protein